MTCRGVIAGILPNEMKFFIRFGLVALVACSLQRIFAGDFDATTETVGRDANGLVTPVNQLVTPAGIQVELPRVRPNALALSPDGKLLVTAGLTHELIVVNPATGKILQHVPFPADKAQAHAGAGGRHHRHRINRRN